MIQFHDAEDSAEKSNDNYDENNYRNGITDLLSTVD
jgi:hypothetical protein